MPNRPNPEEPGVLAGLAVEASTADGRRLDVDASGSNAASAALFARLTERHLDSAYRLATVILGDPMAAEDAAHDAAVLAWRRFDTLREVDRFEQWFSRIVVNVCRDRMRRETRRPVTELRDDDEFTAAGDAAALFADRDALDHAFARLNPDQRVVVALRFYRDMSVDGIAAVLGIPSGTVKSRLHKSLQRLRVELERGGWR